MNGSDEWSPDEALGTETFRQDDVAEDEDERLNPGFRESVELDPSLTPAFVADELELEELGAQLDDPERIVTLAGGMDDPDGVEGVPTRHESADGEGWDLGAPLVEHRSDQWEEDETDDEEADEGDALPG